jgi:hypothetical protein
VNVNGRVQRSPLYRRAAPVIVVITALIAIGAVVFSAHTSRESDRQKADLLSCFDRFATDLAGGLPPVRDATAERDAANAAAMGSLGDGLVKVGAGTFKEADLKAIVAAFAAYREANQKLDQVRAANPYPPAPSTFCADD